MQGAQHAADGVQGARDADLRRGSRDGEPEAGRQAQEDPAVPESLPGPLPQWLQPGFLATATIDD